MLFLLSLVVVVVGVIMRWLEFVVVWLIVVWVVGWGKVGWWYGVCVYVVVGWVLGFVNGRLKCCWWSVRVDDDVDEGGFFYYLLY